MALIAMVVYDTIDNGRTVLTKRTIDSLMQTVNFSRHRLVISDNGSCEGTRDFFRFCVDFPFTLIENGGNIGTANAINRAWSLRERGEHCIKMDNDVVIHQPEWADWIEDVFARESKIGICGLKRKDLDERPWSKEWWYESRVYMLPQEKGQRWLVVEEVQHVMGTCQGYSSAFLDKIGYLYQPGIYGFDDSLAAFRARVAGFKSVFLHGFEIDHIDPGGNEHTEWKRRHAGEHMAEYQRLRDGYRSGELNVYYDGGDMLREWAGARSVTCPS